MTLARIAGLAVRRRGAVVLGWVVCLAAVTAISPQVAGEYDADFATSGSEAQAAAELIAERFPQGSSETVDVVWQASRGVRDDAVRRRIDRFLDRAGRFAGVGEAGPVRIAPGGRIAVASLQLDRRGLVPAQRIRDRRGEQRPWRPGSRRCHPHTASRQSALRRSSTSSPARVPTASAANRYRSSRTSSSTPSL